MSQNHIHVDWSHDLAFVAHQEGRAFNIINSGRFDETGTAVSPKQLLLTSLAGCTGMDMASLLPKMRIPFTKLVIKVTGTLAEDHPKIYTDIHVIYQLDSPKEYLDKIEHAIELSETKYCGVSAMLNKAATITHEVQLI